MKGVKTMTIEGLTLDSVWTFICIGFALIGAFLVIAKFIDQIKKWVRERKEKQALGKTDITKEVADKVVEQIGPQIDEKFKKFETNFNKKFEDIDKKLSDDKELLASHTRQLNEHEGRVGKLEGGTDTLCQGMLALLERDPALNRAAHAMQNYLITRKYNPKDWEVKETEVK